MAKKLSHPARTQEIHPEGVERSAARNVVMTDTEPRDPLTAVWTQHRHLVAIGNDVSVGRIAPHVRQPQEQRRQVR